MKKTAIFMLVLCLALSLCACGRNKEQATEPQVTTTMPEPTILPTMIEPTFETNIPDTNVDDEHMTDMTGEPDAGNASEGDTTPKIKNRITDAN